MVLEPVVSDIHRLAIRVSQKSHMRLALETGLKVNVLQRPWFGKSRHRLDTVMALGCV